MLYMFNKTKCTETLCKDLKSTCTITSMRVGVKEVFWNKTLIIIEAYFVKSGSWKFTEYLILSTPLSPFLFLHDRAKGFGILCNILPAPICMKIKKKWPLENLMVRPKVTSVKLGSPRAAGTLDLPVQLGLLAPPTSHPAHLALPAEQ